MIRSNPIWTVTSHNAQRSSPCPDLVLGRLADESFIICKGDVTWGDSISLVVGDDLNSAVLVDANLGTESANAAGSSPKNGSNWLRKIEQYLAIILGDWAANNSNLCRDVHLEYMTADLRDNADVDSSHSSIWTSSVEMTLR